MKSMLFALIPILVLAEGGCKQNTSEPANTVPPTSSEVLGDFALHLANPNYTDIETKANALNQAALALSVTTSDANLTMARTAWRDTRKAWEQCEAFLFGPVEDFNYDPTMDTWPVNRVDLDSVLASSNTLSLSDVEALPASLKGFHPLEYMLFGIAGTKTPAQFTSREKEYMVSLAQSLLNTTHALRLSWDPGQPDNFTNEFIKAGAGSQRFATRRDAFIAVVTAMAGICEEVANGKMEEPLAAQDSTLEESQFSHNSTADFKNNITGVLNVYLGKYATDGRGLNELVSASNISLANKIQNQIEAAIASFDAIDSNYGKAIYNQQVQIHNAQNAINALKLTLEDDLSMFILTNIKD